VIESQFDCRQYPRIRDDALVSITRVDSVPILAETVDCSPGGIRFACVGINPELGDLLQVTLYPKGRETRVVGKVVHVQDLDFLAQEVGLAFLKADAEILDFLREHLTERKKE
jgi:hypothetical protein